MERRLLSYVSGMIILLLLLFSCGKNTKRSAFDNLDVVAERVMVGNSELISCDLSRLKDTVDIPLSLFIEDLQMVKLDNRDEAMSADAICGFIPLPNGGFVYGLNYGIGVVDPSGKASDWYDKPIVNDLDDYLVSIDFLNKFYHGAFTVNNGNLYFTVNACLFFEEDSNSPFPSLTEDSNPVIVKIKLK